MCDLLPEPLFEICSILVLNLLTILILNNNNDGCNMFVGKHVLQPRVTLWYSVICQILIGIKYLSTVLITMELPSFSLTSGKLPLYYDYKTYWYNSPTVICNIYCQKNFFGCSPLTRFDKIVYILLTNHILILYLKFWFLS